MRARCQLNGRREGIDALLRDASLEQEKIAVIGLGYVGLPVALSFGRKLPTVGFDIRQRRVDELKKGHDDTLRGDDRAARRRRRSSS